MSSDHPRSPRRRILALSSIRSDYDLLSGVWKSLHADPAVDLRLLVSGAHLSPSFGRTVELIERDGLEILARLETLLDSDAAGARLKGASLLLQGSVDLVAAFAPDLIVYPGDREDTIVGALLGAYLGIPTLHVFGGDHVADGHVDNPVRHAVSKLSTMHAVSCEEHRERLLALGEADERIAVVGNPALDRLVAHEPASLDVLRRRLDLPANLERYALVLYHPIAGEDGPATMRHLLDALEGAGLHAVVGLPNSDPGCRALLDFLGQQSSREGVTLLPTQPRSTFHSLYKRAALIAGNSSSGVIEAASVPCPAINVGLRQTGRLAGPNVLWCGTATTEIAEAVSRALDPAFRAGLANRVNPYGDGRGTERLVELVRNAPFADRCLKREDPLAALHAASAARG